MGKKSRRSNVQKGSKPNRNTVSSGEGNTLQEKKYVPDMSSFGTPPQDDPRADFLRELCDGLISDEGMANMETLVAALDMPGIGDPGGIEIAKGCGLGWDRSVPIGSVVDIVGLKSRPDLNGRRAEVISHIYDDMRIGARVKSSGQEVSIKPVNAMLVRENKN